LIVEYKRPGVIAEDSSQSQTRSAIQQLKTYVESIAKRDKQKRLAGVVFDGERIVFVRSREGHWVEEDPIPFTRDSAKRFLEWTAALASDKALTPENLVTDFSIEQLRTQTSLRRLKHALDAALKDSQSLTVGLFEQWRLFFSESIDYEEAFGGGKLQSVEKFARKAGIEIKSADDAMQFFYCLHTYFALIAKLLAWLALSRHLGAKLGGPAFGKLSSLSDEELHRQLEEMESGGIFRKYGLLNLLEGDFFVWYLHAWNGEISEALRDILKCLAYYDPTTMAVHPEETRDLFKKLYHYLLPREIRHNLGEYYTPDWLAERLLAQVDNEFFQTDPRKTDREKLRNKLRELRWLDPACGSGTFLTLIIRRYIELGRALMVPEADLLESITRNVCGFDLNPLAVITARVNYLLAIADLLEHRKGDVAIPVYLADSVATPSYPQTDVSMETGDAYCLNTAVGRFYIPIKVFRHGFDRFCSLLDECVHANLPVEAFMSRVRSEIEDALKEHTDRLTVESLYQELQELHRKGLNGVWARLIKNNFAPLTAGQFDYVVGNPPWINWEHLPDRYREQTRDLWIRYELTHGGRLAIAKVDISALMTYVAADAYLKEGGRLGFVITQAVFKTTWAGRGFRRFSIPKNATPQSTKEAVPLCVLHVDDMVELQPFEGATNRTAVLILDKGRPTRYPVPYTLWRKKRGLPRRRSLTYDSTLEEVMENTERYELVAGPVQPHELTSSWLAVPKLALDGLRKVQGKSPYQAHAGVYTGGANGVYFVEKIMDRPGGLVLIRNVTEGAKRQVDQVTEAVEPDLLYPLLRGRDVSRWHACPSGYIVIGADRTGRIIPEAEMQSSCPRTYGYLSRFREELAARTHCMTRAMIERGEPFYSCVQTASYTFSPWKVVWREVSHNLDAAVVGPHDNKPAIADHTIIQIAVQSSEEAHYIAAALNSAPAALLVLASIVLHPDPHVLEKLALPRFNPTNPAHVRLAELSEQAHKAAAEGKEKELSQIEAKIDKEAAKLWGLTDKELDAIHEALNIMT
jgi:SAM-dependent methyltransferase